MHHPSATFTRLAHIVQQSKSVAALLNGRAVPSHYTRIDVSPMNWHDAGIHAVYVGAFVLARWVMLSMRYIGDLSKPTGTEVLYSGGACTRAIFVFWGACEMKPVCQTENARAPISIPGRTWQEMPGRLRLRRLPSIISEEFAPHIRRWSVAKELL